MSLGTPDLHISTKSAVSGGGNIEITGRADAAHTGIAVLKIKASFDPSADLYPTGAFSLKVSWSDSPKGLVKSTTIEQMNSWGKHSPTVVLTGRCAFSPEPDEKKADGCRYWLLIANNQPANGKGTADMVSILVFDRAGNRVIYGTGPIVSGDLDVSASGN